MRASKLLVVKTGWVVAVAAVLVWALGKIRAGGLSETLEYEVGLAHLIFVGALSFPLGPAVLFVLYRAVKIIHPSLLEGGGTAEIVFVWTACVISGYIQWFILLPSAYKKLRQRLHSRN